jgi:hypothetical protein
VAERTPRRCRARATEHHPLHARRVRGRRRGLPDEGFLHVALFTDDLDAQVAGHDVQWGPEIVSGPTFGTRRIVFVDAPGAMRLEFMEQLEEPA